MKSLPLVWAAPLLLGLPTAAQLTADITASTTSGPAPLAVTFTAQASGGRATQASWSFGDGTTASGRRATHTYTAAGTYTVELTLQGPGGTATTTRPDWIVVTPGGPAGLDVDFTAEPTTGAAPLTVRFTSLVIPGQATSGTWDFGDGQTGAARAPRHTYTQPGTYTVALTAQGPSGSDTETKAGLIVVTPASGMALDFDATPTTGLAPLTVSFTALGANGYTSGLWDFGDGMTSTLRAPIHVYTQPGTYTVSLTADGPTGPASRTREGFITVDAPPAPAPIVVESANDLAGLGSPQAGGLSGRAGGAVWFDYNGDHLPDLLIATGSSTANFLFRNDGDGTFTDVSPRLAKPDPSLGIAGAACGDLNGDGTVDVWLAATTGGLSAQPILLFMNRGDGTFLESSSSLAGALAGIGGLGGASLADLDRDGLPDAYLTAKDGTANLLLANDGAAGFADSTAALGLDSLGRETAAVAWLDADQDGWLDLYLANRRPPTGPPDSPEGRDLFYRGGCPSPVAFCEVTAGSPGLGDDAPNATDVVSGDLDNDGDFDLVVANDPTDTVGANGLVLYRNIGDGTFEDDSADLYGLSLADGVAACRLLDFDQDGWLDLWAGTSAAAAADGLFHNDGLGGFVAVQDTTSGNAVRAAAAADFDADGDLDLVVVNDSGPSTLYRNISPARGNFLEVRLVGRTSNTSALGAVVRATAGTRTLVRHVAPGNGTSQDDACLHFGLGSAVTVTLEVSWPSGLVQTFSDVSANAFLIIDERDGILPERLTVTGSRKDPATGELVVSVRSNYGGRTRIVDSEGRPLLWDPESGGFQGRFPSTSTPIRILSARGAEALATLAPRPRRP